MALELYNTLTRSKEPFVPADPGRVTMYVCGLTVYNYPHIGNARSAVVFDALARLLRTRYRLVYARNITDVDDKINAAAAAAGRPIGDIAARFTAACHEDWAGLGVLPPDVEPAATDHIADMIAMIGDLVAGGHAYPADGHVLFRVKSFADYGRLSRRGQRELLAGARVEVAPYKEDPGDFVLWKPSTPELPGWESPWGRGRPGWHIECSAMAARHLGATIDIHGGGNDLIFPHHENEIAQSVCAHDGAPLARYWVHNGFLNVDETKMSKSVGNIVLVRDLLARAPGEVIRLALLSAHYRQPLDWSEDVLTDARRKLDRLYGTLRDVGGWQDRWQSEAPDRGVSRGARGRSQHAARTRRAVRSVPRSQPQRGSGRARQAGGAAARQRGVAGPVGGAARGLVHHRDDDIAQYRRRGADARRAARGACPPRLRRGRQDPCRTYGGRHRHRGRARWHALAPCRLSAMTEIEQAEREVIEEFRFFDNWMDRYQYLIDLGRKLPPFPEELKDETHRVHGCQSQVWLTTSAQGDRLKFQAISDSAIVSGLIAILMRVYDGRRAAEILTTPPAFIREIGLDEHLSPTRSNGLRAMLKAIGAAAAAVPAGVT